MDTLGALMGAVVDPAKAVLMPSSQTLGHGLNIVTRLLTLPLRRLEPWLKDQEEKSQIVSLIADKIKDIPESDLLSPTQMVAQSATEGMILTKEEPELFDQFTNLLANSMVRHCAYGVHPAFPDILKQMTSSEAKLARWFFLNHQPKRKGDRHRVPFIRFSVLGNKISYYFGRDVCAIFNDCDDKFLSACINNMGRLGLIDMPIYFLAQYDDSFSSVEEDAYAAFGLEMGEISRDFLEKIERAHVYLNDFGLLFLNACLVPPRASNVLGLPVAARMSAQM